MIKMRVVWIRNSDGEKDFMELGRFSSAEEAESNAQRYSQLCRDRDYRCFYFAYYLDANICAYSGTFFYDIDTGKMIGKVYQ